METNDKVKKRLPWMHIGIGVLVVAGVVAIGVLANGLYKSNEESKQLASNMVGMQQKLEGLKTDIQTVQHDSEQASDALRQAITTLTQAQTNDKDAWRILEAQYYVKLADTNLTFENNFPVAIQLLQTADNNIRELNNPKLDPIRKALADDVMALQNVPIVDYTGLYLRLVAVDNTINQLPILVKDPQKNLSQVIVPSENVWWKRGLAETWQTLQKIVVIRYHESGVPPLVTPAQQDFIQENLHAMLQKSMWGLLNKNPGVYQASLQQSADWIKQYYLASSPVTQNVLQNITQLAQLNVNPATPKITASLQAFHDYLAAK